MKKLIAVALAAAVSLSAASLTLVTGSTSGNYYNVTGPSLAKEMRKLGHIVKVVPGKGTVGNMEAVAGRSTVIGLGEASVVEANEDLFESLGTTGQLGAECGFLAVRNTEDGPRELSKLKGKKIAVGKKKSGTFADFKMLAENNPELAAMKVKHKSGLNYLGKVASNKYGAMFFMTSPDPKNPLIKEVVNNKNLTFADVEDLNLGEYGEGEDPIFVTKSIPVRTNYIGNKVLEYADAVCTYTTIIADEDAIDQSVLEDLYKASKNVRTTKHTMFSLFNDAKSKAKGALK